MFEALDLVARGVNELFDILRGGLVDHLDDELRVVKMGESLFQMAQAGGELSMHDVMSYVVY